MTSSSADCVFGGVRLISSASSRLVNTGPSRNWNAAVRVSKINEPVTSPGIRSALLEVMEERQVSVEGDPRPLPEPFVVAATQNPIEYEGTYPLPEAQLDRFLLKLSVPLPSRDEELGVLRAHHAGFDPRDLAGAGVRPVAGGADPR